MPDDRYNSGRGSGSSRPRRSQPSSQRGPSQYPPQRSSAQSQRSSSQSHARQELSRTQQNSSRTHSTQRVRRKRSAGARVAGAFLYVLLVIGGSAILATVGWVWACDLLGLNKEYAAIEVTIDENTDFDTVVDQLEQAGLIQYKFLFKLYAQFSHAQDKIAPGRYELTTEMDYHALVSSMGSSSSTRLTTDITIKEGLTIDQIFDLLADRGVTSVDKLREMAADYDYAFDWLRGIPLGDYHRLEGYLFPDTYTFEMGENPKYVINKMLVNFDSKMDQYMAQYSGDEVQYSLHDIVTIASMIEKETDGTTTEERNDYKDIASVIYNRLENPTAETAGYLNIDATLVYINGGRVPTEADKAINSPYNTYLHQGLPAGPISNPGMQSLLAAMSPSNSNYYYYVLNPETKQHEYTRTFAEHDALVQRYGSAAND